MIKKHWYTSTSLIAALAVLLCAAASAKAESTGQNYLQAYGWLVGSQSGLIELQLTEAESKDVVAGVKTAAADEDLTVDLQQVGPKMEAYLMQRSTAIAEAAAAGKSANIPAASSAEKAYLEILGWLVAQRAGLPQLGLNGAEVAAFNRGIDDALKGRQSVVDLQQEGPAIQGFLSERMNATILAASAGNIAAAEEKTAELQKDPEYKTTASGLIYRIIKPGSGPKPSASDKVKVHYTGSLLDGKVFDSSVKRGRPIDFFLNEVIPGWTEGVQLIGKGGEIELYIPYELAYGAEGSPPAIPPASMLHFNVQLLDIVD